MECIEARALKSSFLSGKSTYLHHQGGAYYDELLSVAGGINNVVVNSEDFSVDDLLDLSDKNINGSDYSEKDEEEEEEEKDSFSVSSRDYDVNSNSSAFSGDGMFDPLPAGELIVPEEEMENLEWLSQLVDDSVPDMSSFCPPPPAPAGRFEEKTSRLTTNRFSVPRPAVQEYSVLGFSYPVPRKARTQRSRISRRVWPIGSFSLVESSSASSSSIDSSVTSPVLFTNPVQVMDSFWAFGKPPLKKQKKTPSTEASGSGISGSQMQRRCSHCGVQKTPQWRTGPLGPKTLCNACGVRFKSGRLFPEYRPACSPTFSVEAHSNSHRKVLEMRRKKEMSEMGSMSEPGLAHMVPIF